MANDSIARLDAHVLRRHAAMVVTGAAEYEEVPRILDLTKQSPADLLKAYAAKMERFATAPCDPHGEKLRFYEGGYTIWSGFPGMGKTTFLAELECHLLASGQGVFAGHFEDDPGEVLIRTAGVCYATDMPTLQQMTWFMDWYSEKYCAWGLTRAATVKEIFGIIKELSQKGIKQFVVDSFMCLDIDSEDNEGQRKFANALADLTVTTQTHVHLVAHPRKLISSDQEPDQNDIAGSANLARRAHNIVFIRRGAEAGSNSHLSAMSFLIRKQRIKPSFLGNITGWFNRNHRQFASDQFRQFPTQYLPHEAYQ